MPPSKGASGETSKWTFGSPEPNTCVQPGIVGSDVNVSKPALETTGGAAGVAVLPTAADATVGRREMIRLAIKQERTERKNNRLMRINSLFSDLHLTHH